MSGAGVRSPRTRRGPSDRSLGGGTATVLLGILAPSAPQILWPEKEETGLVQGLCSFLKRQTPFNQSHLLCKEKQKLWVWVQGSGWGAPTAPSPGLGVPRAPAHTGCCSRRGDSALLAFLLPPALRGPQHGEHFRLEIFEGCNFTGQCLELQEDCPLLQSRGWAKSCVNAIKVYGDGA